MILYDTDLLDEFQESTGFSDEQIDAWLIRKSVIYSNMLSSHDWASSPKWCDTYVHECVTYDIQSTITMRRLTRRA